MRNTELLEFALKSTGFFVLLISDKWIVGSKQLK